MHPATFATKRDFNAHRLLRAIDNNTLLSKLSAEEQADAEARGDGENDAEDRPTDEVLLDDLPAVLEVVHGVLQRRVWGGQGADGAPP